MIQRIALLFIIFYAFAHQQLLAELTNVEGVPIEFGKVSIYEPDEVFSKLPRRLQTVMDNAKRIKDFEKDYARRTGTPATENSLVWGKQEYSSKRTFSSEQTGFKRIEVADSIYILQDQSYPDGFFYYVFPELSQLSQKQKRAILEFIAKKSQTWNWESDELIESLLESVSARSRTDLECLLIDARTKLSQISKNVADRIQREKEWVALALSGQTIKADFSKEDNGRQTLKIGNNRILTIELIPLYSDLFEQKTPEGRALEYLQKSVQESLRNIMDFKEAIRKANFRLPEDSPNLTKNITGTSKLTTRTAYGYDDLHIIIDTEYTTAGILRVHFKSDPSNLLNASEQRQYLRSTFNNLDKLGLNSKKTRKTVEYLKDAVIELVKE